MKWSLPKLLDNVHTHVEGELTKARDSIDHTSTLGDASESVWIELFNTYLPKRYRAAKAFVVDSKGDFSEQIDVVIYDQQYSPLIWSFMNQTFVAAESVYAVFEAKQDLNADYIKAAVNKAESVRRLYRTSLPIPHAGGVYPPKPLIRIIAGILTLDSAWADPMGKTLIKNLAMAKGDARLDIGCAASHGFFRYDEASADYSVVTDGKHATAFLFSLLSLLQESATVPMIDIDAYSHWLTI